VIIVEELWIVGHWIVGHWLSIMGSPRFIADALDSSPTLPLPRAAARRGSDADV
jgi:hypothetical protein